jgi:hypothetical protein
LFTFLAQGQAKGIKKSQTFSLSTHQTFNYYTY